MANLLADAGMGYERYPRETIKHGPLMWFTIVIAVGIINEARSTGWWSTSHWWHTRASKTLMWLTAPLALRGVALYIGAKALGLEHPLIVAGALVATDPAAVGLAIGLVGHTRYLAGISWQLTVESLYNDVIGLFVIGVGAGLTARELGMNVVMSVVAGTILAALIALIAQLLRSRGLERKLEVAILIAIATAYLYVVGYNEIASVIFVVVIAMSLYDVLDAVYLLTPSKESQHAITHQWEVGNVLGLACILGFYAWNFPIQGALRYGLKGLAMATALVLIIAITRYVAAYGEERGYPVFDTEGGLRYGTEVNPLLWLAGVTLLGVPSLGALENYSHGSSLAPVVMFETIGLSLLVVPIAVRMFIRVEKEFSLRYSEMLGGSLASRAVIKLVRRVRSRQGESQIAAHPEVPHD